jgi:hypothetical protein
MFESGYFFPRNNIDATGGCGAGGQRSGGAGGIEGGSNVYDVVKVQSRSFYHERKAVSIGQHKGVFGI